MASIGNATMIVTIKVKLSFIDVLKLALLGGRLNRHVKITVQEMVNKQNAS